MVHLAPFPGTEPVGSYGIHDSRGDYSVRIKQAGYNGGDSCFATNPAAFFIKKIKEAS
jgi:hypothetical protein